MRQAALNAVAQGRLPVWDPNNFAGTPLLADPQAGLFYPGSVLYYLLPGSTAGLVFFALHALLLAAGLWSLAREWGHPRWVAALQSGIPLISLVALGLVVLPAYQVSLLLAACAWFPWLFLRKSAEVRPVLLVLIASAASAKVLLVALVLLYFLKPVQAGFVRRFGAPALAAVVALAPLYFLYGHWLSNSLVVSPPAQVETLAQWFFVASTALAVWLAHKAPAHRTGVVASCAAGMVLVLSAVFVVQTSQVGLGGFHPKPIHPDSTAKRGRVLGRPWLESSTVGRAGLGAFLPGSTLGKDLRFAWGEGSRAPEGTAKLWKYADRFGRPLPEGIMSIFAITHYLVGDRKRGARVERFRKPVAAGMIGLAGAYDGTADDWAGMEKSLLDRGVLIEASRAWGGLARGVDSSWTILPLERPNAETLVVPVGGATEDSWVFLSESDFPGWKARVDGKPAALFRAELAFMAVPIPKGAEQLVLQYEVPALAWLLSLGLAGLAGIILLDIRTFPIAPH